MGNRAVITTRENFDNNGIGIYLHWNGGRDNVEAFLKYCELKGYRSPDSDSYGWARLCQVIGNFFGGSTSLGIDVVNRLDCDNGDNGTYIIKDWKIVDRKYFDWNEQEQYDMTEMLCSINECMPENERLDKDFLLAEEIPTSELQVGDIVYVQHYDGKITKNTVIGFGEDGYYYKGKPFVDLYQDNKGSYESNINNYILEENVRVAERKYTK